VGHGGHHFFEVPPIGKPFFVRRAPDVAVVLDEFAPTHLDSWRGRAALPASAASGKPSDAPVVIDDLLVVRAVVVRHGGDVRGRTPHLGRRRHALDVLVAGGPAEALPETPLVAVVLEQHETTVCWVRGVPDQVSAELSQADWRSSGVC
jgi:hypothetical protein